MKNTSRKRALDCLRRTPKGFCAPVNPGNPEEYAILERTIADFRRRIKHGAVQERSLHAQTK